MDAINTKASSSILIMRVKVARAAHLLVNEIFFPNFLWCLMPCFFLFFFFLELLSIKPMKPRQRFEENTRLITWYFVNNYSISTFIIITMFNLFYVLFFQISYILDKKVDFNFSWNKSQCKLFDKKCNNSLQQSRFLLPR